MARITLKCGCGWTFFIPDSTQGHELPCPRCRVMVSIPGRQKGAPVLTAVELALQHQRRSEFRRKAVFGSIGLTGAALLGWMISALVTTSRPAEEDDAAPRTRDRASSASSHRVILTAPAPEAPIVTKRPESAGPSGEQVETWKRELLHQVHQLNLAGIVSEVLRLRGLIAEHEALLLRAKGHEEKIQFLAAELKAGGQKPALEVRFAPGDRIVGFTQKDLHSLRPLDAAKVLAAFLQGFRANALEQAFVVRDGAQVQIIMHFPEETKELLQLARHPALSSEPLVAPGAPPCPRTSIPPSST